MSMFRAEPKRLLGPSLGLHMSLALSSVLLASGCAAGASSGTSTSTPPTTSIVTSIGVIPVVATVIEGSSQNFTADVYDQYGKAMNGVVLSWQDASETIASSTGYASTLDGIKCGTTNLYAVAPNGVSGSATVVVTSTTDFNCLPPPPNQTLTSSGALFVSLTCNGATGTEATPLMLALGSSVQCVVTLPKGYIVNGQCADGSVKQPQGTSCISEPGWTSDNSGTASITSNTAKNNSFLTATLSDTAAGVTLVYASGNWAQYNSAGTSSPTSQGTFYSNSIYSQVQ